MRMRNTFSLARCQSLGVCNNNMELTERIKETRQTGDEIDELHDETNKVSMEEQGRLEDCSVKN